MVTSADPPLIVGIGELLWDCFGERRHPGGAPTNVVYHASQLGNPAVILSAVGEDASGDELLAALQDRGLETGYIQRDPAHATGTVTVDDRDPSDPHYTIHHPAAWDHLRVTPAWEAVLQRARAVSFGTLAQRTPGRPATFARALAAAPQAIRVLDVNLRSPWYTQEVVAGALQQAHVVKLSEGEIATVAELLETPARAPEAFAHWLFDHVDGPDTAAFASRLVCVTRGEAGCLLITPTQTLTVPATPVTVVDAVGAGDAFTAALIHGLVRDWPLERVGGFANRIGGLVASRAGAMPDLSRELAALHAAPPAG